MRWSWLAPWLLACASAPAPVAAPVKVPRVAPAPASAPTSTPTVTPSSTSAATLPSTSTPSSTPSSPPSSPPTSTPARASVEATRDDPLPNVRVTGLEGTLNKDDVHQTMDAREPAFDVCIKEVRRRHGWVHGTIRFDFAVDGAGKVEVALPVESDIGHKELERCLTRVVAETQFPKPAGRARARFSWDMRVHGVVRGRTDLLEPDVMKRILERKASDVFKDCKVRRRKHRFQVTLYAGRTGRVLSVGAIPTRAVEEEQLDCVVEAVASWKLPKQKHRSKVSFLLR